MKGSSALGYKTGDLTRVIVALSDASTVPEFSDRLIRVIAPRLQHTKVFIVTALKEFVFDETMIEPNGALAPSWLQSQLAHHPDLARKLEQGETVAMFYPDNRASANPTLASGTHLFLHPLIFETELLGMIGLMLIDSFQQAAEELELVGQLCQCVSTGLRQVQQVEMLRATRRTALSEKESLKAIHEMQSHLQSNIAHELRTPLATVRGYTRMILDGRAGEISQTQRDYLNIVSENTNRLINLVNWMSQVAQYGSHHLRLSDASLNELWSECVKLHEANIAEKSIVIKEQIRGDSFVTCCDRSKIAYVFSSLLANAIRYSRREGRISVEFSRGRQREINVKISNSGGGIPPDQVSQIFERHHSLSFPSDPTALGLAGVYDIIGLHGGRLFVNSRPDEGSTFLFTLPAVRQDSEEKSGDDQAVHFGRRRR